MKILFLFFLLSWISTLYVVFLSCTSGAFLKARFKFHLDSKDTGAEGRENIHFLSSPLAVKQRRWAVCVCVFVLWLNRLILSRVVSGVFCLGYESWTEGSIRW